MKTTRNASLDILRITAAMAVVLFHVLGGGTNNDPQATDAARSLCSAFSAMLKWHVPVFYMITGYLWLANNKTCTFPKVLPNVRRFFLVLMTVGLFYGILERFFYDRTISLNLLLSAMGDVFTGQLWAHMWYLYAIIGVYLFLPVIKPFFTHSTVGAIGMLVGLLFLFTIFAPAIAGITGYTFPVEYPIGSPAFYVCTGGFLAKKSVASRITALWSMALLAVSSASAFYLTWAESPLLSLLPVFTCFSAVSLFGAITTLCSRHNSPRWLRSAAGCSFGIYLFHPLFLNLMVKVLHLYPLRFFPILSIPLTAAALFLFSYCLTGALRKIPCVKKYIL